MAQEAAVCADAAGAPQSIQHLPVRLDISRVPYSRHGKPQQIPPLGPQPESQVGFLAALEPPVGEVSHGFDCSPSIDTSAPEVLHRLRPRYARYPFDPVPRRGCDYLRIDQQASYARHARIALEAGDGLLDEPRFELHVSIHQAQEFAPCELIA